MAEQTEPTVRQQKARFKPGQSGNPAGRKPGSKHAALAALDAIGTENAEALLRAVTQSAMTGDMRAAEIILRRVWPERKGRPVNLTLPAISSSADLIAGMSAIMQAVTAGEITPDEGQALAALIETQRKAIETHDLAARIEALEHNAKETRR